MKLFLFAVCVFFLSITVSSQTFDLSSEYFKVGDVFNAKHRIVFKYNSAEIAQQPCLILDSLAQFLIKHDSLVVKIGTHRDSRGSEYYSKRITMVRARSIVRYLIGKGVKNERMVAYGGEHYSPIIEDSLIAKIINREEKEAAYAVNRRTEITILRTDFKEELPTTAVGLKVKQEALKKEIEKFKNLVDSINHRKSLIELIEEHGVACRRAPPYNNQEDTGRFETLKGKLDLPVAKVYHHDFHDNDSCAFFNCKEKHHSRRLVLGVDSGVQVSSVSDGTVVAVIHIPDRNKTAILIQNGPYFVLYNSVKSSLKRGDVVCAHQIIGKTESKRLKLEIWKGSSALNSLDWFVMTRVLVKYSSRFSNGKGDFSEIQSDSIFNIQLMKSLDELKKINNLDVQRFQRAKYSYFDLEWKYRMMLQINFIYIDMNLKLTQIQRFSRNENTEYRKSYIFDRSQIHSNVTFAMVRKEVEEFLDFVRQ